MTPRELIQRHEGIKLSPYMDTAKPPRITIGVGRNLTDKGISTQEALYLLDNDVQETLIACNAYPWFQGLSEPRKAAVMSLMFNLGPGGFRKFVKFISAMAARNYEQAGDELTDSTWYAQVGVRGHEIVNLIKHEAWPNG